MILCFHGRWASEDNFVIVLFLEGALVISKEILFTLNECLVVWFPVIFGTWFSLCFSKDLIFFI
jgi:hypothetical protein